MLCEWAPGDDSPDRLDAMVWAYSELLESGEPGKMLEQDITKTNSPLRAFGRRNLSMRLKIGNSRIISRNEIQKDLKSVNSRDGNADIRRDDFRRV
jgi:hypothetical protein